MSARTTMKTFAAAALVSACACANADAVINPSGDTNASAANSIGGRSGTSNGSTLVFEQAGFDNSAVWWGARGPYRNGTSRTSTWLLLDHSGNGRGIDHGDKAVSVDDDAVPEPSRWLMMISGVGVLGAIVLRRTLID